MGTRGPKRSDPETLKIHGNYRDDRHRGMAVGPEGTPTCPAWLKGFGREKWKEVIKIMREMDVLTLADRDFISLYCTCLADAHEAGEQLKITGLTCKLPNGCEVAHPLVAIRRQAIKQAASFGKALGLSAIDRRSIPVNNPPPKSRVPSMRFDGLPRKPGPRPT